MKHSKSQSPHVQISETLSHFWEDIVLKMEAEAVPFLAIPPIIERIEWWVSAQPELTQVLCDYVVEYASQITEEKAESIVDFIVEKEIVNGGEDSLAAKHFNKISQVILQDDRKDSALIVYLQILQWGQISADSSPEQAVLLKSGLVNVESGYLKVSNALYEKTFTLNKVEQMLPGITKPVTVVSPAAPRAHHLSKTKTSKLYSKLAIAACGIVVVGALISSYIRESGGQAFATPSDTLNDRPASATGKITSTSERSSDTSTSNKASIKKVNVTDRALFDNGKEHAINSRWVLMMREFCNIPEASMYFSPAQKQVKQLSKLYSEDIQVARNIVQAEKGESCSM
ncbi:MAG: hypothetical protein AAGC93_03265 [Cyanobacteria bacterium P01_F01_bin.53]